MRALGFLLFLFVIGVLVAFSCFGQPPLPTLPTLPEPFILTTNAVEFISHNEKVIRFTVISHPSDTVVTNWGESYVAELVVTTNWIRRMSFTLGVSKTNGVVHFLPSGEIVWPDGKRHVVLSATNHLRTVPSKL